MSKAKTKRKIHYRESIGGHAALAKAYTAYRVELEQKGFNEGGSFGAWYNLHGLFIRDGRHGPVIGFMLFQYVDYNDSYHLNHGWIAPAYRKGGLYNQLWAELVKRAKGKDVQRITSGTHVNNKAMQKVAEKQGRKQTFLHYEYEI